AGLGHVDDGELAVAVHDDLVAFVVGDGLEVDELDLALVPGLERRLLGAAARGAADVEGPHGELRAGLADRLRGDDADRLAKVHHLPAREVAAVATAAHALA